MEFVGLSKANGRFYMGPRYATKLSRRLVLAGAATAFVGTRFSTPAIGQGTTNLKMTLPWLPQGSQLFAFVARNRGFWKARGLNVDIARGFGSGAAIQT